MSFLKDLVLYTGDDCHLCDQAKKLLFPIIPMNNWNIIETNISSSQRLTKLYGHRIPVVVFPSGFEKGWPFTASQIKLLIGKEL
jgi:hypothetical protein